MEALVTVVVTVIGCALLGVLVASPLIVGALTERWWTPLSRRLGPRLFR